MDHIDNIKPHLHTNLPTKRPIRNSRDAGLLVNTWYRKLPEVATVHEDGYGQTIIED